MKILAGGAIVVLVLSVGVAISAQDNGLHTIGPPRSEAAVLGSSTVTPSSLASSTSSKVASSAKNRTSGALGSSSPSFSLTVIAGASDSSPTQIIPPALGCDRWDMCGVQPADELEEHPASGVQGHVTISPTTPVCRIDTPCSGPYSGNFEIVQSGHIITTFTSANDGSYRVSLAPGTYLIQKPSSEGRFPYFSPVEVSVTNGYITVDLDVDSGIR